MFTKSWVQPVLTSYTGLGTLTVHSASGTFYGWHASDGIHDVQANTWEAAANAVPGWLKWELPYPISISAITLYNKYTGNTRLTKDVSVYADEDKTKLIGSGTFPAGVAFGQLDITADTIYESNIIYVDLASTYNMQVGLAEIAITATVAGTLTIAALPTKLVYTAGEPLDTDGLSITINYADGTSEAVTDYTVSGYNPNTIGVQNIFVTYQGEEVSFSVTTNSIPVQSVEICEHACELVVGASKQETVSVMPSTATYQSVVWSSSNDSVVTVIDGLVTAVSAGTATIVCVSTDNALATDELVVSVVNPHINVSSITLSAQSLSLGVGSTDTLSYALLPADATDQSVQWSSSDPSVASVHNGYIVARLGGTAIITCASVDNPSIYDTCTVVVTSVVPVTDDTLYNSTDRIIQQKFVIHFADNPLTVTKDNYLVSSSILEETQSDTKSYLGNTTSNELDLSLFNDQRIFTPTNTESPYYGKIVKNLQIDAFMRVYDGVEREWDAMGIFYVTSWVASADGLLVSVTANDAIYRVLQSPQPNMPITLGITHKSLFEAYFAAFGITALVDDDIIDVLTYAYISGTPKEFLTSLSLGAMADCFCDRFGNAKVKSKAAPRGVRATLTDNDQIVSVSITQSIDTGYDGSQVTCNAKQESLPESVLSIKNAELVPGTNSFENVALTTALLVRLNHIAVTGLSHVEVRNIAASPSHVSFDIHNPGVTSTLSDVTVYGNTLETVSTVLTDAGDELLKLDSGYVQTLAHASRVKAFVDKIVANKIPTLTLKARGNPLLHLGDLVHISSTRYKLEYDGILIRSTYDYDGGLHATYIFAAAQAFLEVE